MSYSDYMAANFDVINSLRRLGLNQYEAKAYFALASFGEHTAGELAERAELPRPRVYDVLSKLQDKGFVLIQKGRPVRYAALPVLEAVKTLKKQMEAELAGELAKVDALGKELGTRIKARPREAEGGENVWSIRGREAIYSKIASMIANSKREVIVASTPEGVAHKLKAFARELEKARARGVKIHVVSPNTGDAAKVAHCIHDKTLPTRLLVADDHALLFLSDHKARPEDEIGLWLKSQHFTQTLRHTLGTCK